MGVCEITFVVLLILKLCGVIAVSWWVVFAPLMVSVAIIVGFVLFTRGILNRF
jgi:hypothetical protein